MLAGDMKKGKKGFIILVTLSFLAVLLFAAMSIVGLGCGEIFQARGSNDITAAYHVATAGAEMMYNYLKSKEGQIVTFPQSVPSADSAVRTLPSGGITVGTFNARANGITSDVFGIVSAGTVNGKTAVVTVKYGFDSPFTNGYPLGSIGPMRLSGTRLLSLRSWVRVEGPLASGFTISTNNFVKVSGEELENMAYVQPTFWWKYDAAAGAWIPKAVNDSNGNGQYLTDTNGDGQVTIADAGDNEGLQQEFIADDVTGDSVINNDDGFFSYYTIELNKMGLGIAPGQANFYSGDQQFNPWSVPSGTPIIFVNGNVDISFNDTEWWGGSSDHTIVATGDITIVQPTNGNNDTLTLISNRDVNTGGVRAFGGVRGNIVIYASGDFNAYYGGRTNGTIFACGSVNVDTVLPIPGLLNRDMNKSKDDWLDPANWPLGLPQNYNMTASPFRIKDEVSEYVPVWQRG
jgi:hypothetical protein